MNALILLNAIQVHFYFALHLQCISINTLLIHCITRLFCDAFAFYLIIYNAYAMFLWRILQCISNVFCVIQCKYNVLCGFFAMHLHSISVYTMLLQCNLVSGLHCIKICIPGAYKLLNVFAMYLPYNFFFEKRIRFESLVDTSALKTNCGV